MCIDVKKPINLALSDPKWIQKLLIGGLFYLVFQIINSIIGVSDYLVTRTHDFSTLPIIAIFSAITFKLSIIILLILLNAVPIGYVLQSVHNQLNGSAEILPEWSRNISSFFINGLKYIFIKIIYSIILSLLLAIPVISGLTIFSVYINKPIISYLGVAIFAFIAVFIILGYLLILPLIFIAFAENYVIQDAFNIKKFYSIVFNNLNDYILCDLVVLAAFILQLLLSVLLVCTCIGILLIPFLYLPFFLFVINLFTQVYLNAKSSS